MLHSTKPYERFSTSGRIVARSDGGSRRQQHGRRLLRRSFDGVEHDVIDLNDQAPYLAASSFITVKD
jgi:hypothetical protein